MSLHVVTGCMFSGKSEKLLFIASVYDNLDVIAFTHGLDAHSDESRIVSRSGGTRPAHRVQTVGEIKTKIEAWEKIRPPLPPEFAAELEPPLVVIDECQFFGDEEEFVTLVLDLAKRYDVLLGGLSSDFNGEAFGPLSTLIRHADQVSMMRARCDQCAKEHSAIWSARKHGVEGGRVLPGGTESYMALCRTCRD